jgi:hypothetical protein
VEKKMEKSVVISAQCLAFAEHLLTLKPDQMLPDQVPESAIALDLQRWRISPAEWSLAQNAAKRARQSGQDLKDCLFAAAGGGLLDRVSSIPADNSPAGRRARRR